MEITRETFSVVVTVRSVVLSSVERGIDMVRVLADILHDVNFSAFRPPLLSDVFPEKPEGRPDTLTEGKLSSHLKFAIHDGELVSSGHSSRGVSITLVIFSNCLNDKVASGKVGVLGSVSVVLEFFVASADVAYFKVPLSAIDSGSIELVIPDLNPASKS